MNKTIAIVTAIVMWATCASAQEITEEFKPSGRVEGRIFADFSTDVTGNGHAKAFELKRAYLGYIYQISPEFKAHIRMDVGGNEFVIDGLDEGIESQYAFFKTAALFWEKNKWSAAFGLHDTYQFKEQETLWGKRYILPSMLDLQKFDFSADIGASARFRTNNFEMDLGFFNGEGYKQLQTDNAFRGSFGITGFFWDKKIIARGYIDQSSADVHLGSYTAFAGLDLDKFTLGAEFTHQNNYTYVEGHNRDAYSIFTQYNFTPRFGLWLRIDGLNSQFELEYDKNDAEEAADAASYMNSWMKKDGLYTYTGIEYIIVPRRITTSLNYQHQTDDTADKNNTGRLFLNLEVKF